MPNLPVWRNRPETQRAEAEEQRAAAEANLKKAKQAVDEYFTLVSELSLIHI